MNPDKKALLEEAYQRFVDISMGKISIKGNEDILDDTISGFGTTVDEVILSLDDFIKQSESLSNEGSEVSIEFNSEWIRIEFSEDENSAIISELGSFIVNSDSVEQSISVRLSTMFVFNGKDWKVLHYHGSSPVMSENDPYHINEWEKRNAELEAEVKERTKELEQRKREAEVEIALERVRSRSMAMQKGEELVEVVRLLDNEIAGLGIEINGTQIITDFTNPKDGLNDWFATDGYEYLEKFYIPYIVHPATEKFIDALNKDVDFYTDNYSKTEKNNYFRLLFKDSDFKKIPKERQEQIYDSPGWVRAVLVSNNSTLIFQRYILQEFTKNEEDIFKRIGKVFEQAYTRFLDLQKAEIQTRQALIEAALERVRGMAMAMNHSDDINQIAEAIFNELGILQVNPLRVGVGIIDEETKAIQTWTSTIQKEQPVTVSGNIPVSIHPMLRAGFKAWQGNEVRFIYKLDGKEKESFYDRLSQTNYKIFEDHYKINPDNPHFWCNVIFKTGFLFFVIDHEPEETDLSLLERFGDVFQLAYTRFEDLQKVEEQTKESLRKASLDRVRAEISSMRNSEDLEQITPLIWEELITLNVPFFRCGIFIMDEPNQLIHTYLSKPDGKSLAVLNLPYESSKLAKNSIASWRKREVYREIWDQDQFMNWVHSLNESHFIDSEEEYQGSEAPPKKLALHFLPFKQGMLYVGSKESLDDDQIETAQSLANAFEVAYARYEDFQQLENTLHKLETTQDQLVQQEKLASLGQLTAGIAHEIKNPLNFVNNFSELSDELVQELIEALKEGDLEDANDIATDISQNLKKIYEHGSRADRIVKSMLQHSRYGNNSKQQTNLNSLVKEFVNLTFHGMRAGDHPINVDIEFSFDDSIKELDLIAEDFSRVVVNLCNNAFDAMREKIKSNGETYKPKLTVESHNSNGNTILVIKDNGSGIPEDLKDKIMQPFFTTKKGTDGTGLGLSITNDIIKAHGGKLEVESKENQYTLFKVYLT